MDGQDHSSVDDQKLTLSSGRPNDVAMEHDSNELHDRSLQDENKRPSQNLGDVIDQKQNLEKRCKSFEQEATQLSAQRNRLRARVSTLMAERRDLEQRIREIMDEKSNMQKDRHEIEKIMEKEKADNRKLRELITRYKIEISASSRIESQIADDMIRANSEAVFYSIQEFVVKTFRGASFGTSPMLSSTSSVISLPLLTAL